MIDAYIHETLHGPSLTIVESEERCREIQLGALASWSELLGLSEMEEALEAIMRFQDDPDPDPYLWHEPFLLLQRREQDREDAAYAAMDEGRAENPQSPVLRATLAVKDSPVERALEACQQGIRDRLGCPRRGAKPSIVRGAPLRTATTQGAEVAKVVSACSPYGREVQRMKSDFCHSLTDYDHDPFVEQGAEPVSVDDLIAKYTEAA